MFPRSSIYELLMAMVGIETRVEWEADNSMNVPSLSDSSLIGYCCSAKPIRL